MEASLMQVYAPRDPLAEYLRGEISLRKLRVMVEGIPLTPETPVGRAVLGPWGDRDRMLRLAVWELQRLNASYYNAHRGQGAEAATPRPLPEPEPTEYQIEAAKAARKKPDAEIAYEHSLLEVIARNQN